MGSRSVLTVLAVVVSLWARARPCAFAAPSLKACRSYADRYTRCTIVDDCRGRYAPSASRDMPPSSGPTTRLSRSISHPQPSPKLMPAPNLRCVRVTIVLRLRADVLAHRLCLSPAPDNARQTRDPHVVSTIVSSSTAPTPAITDSVPHHRRPLQRCDAARARFCPCDDGRARPWR